MSQCGIRWRGTCNRRSKVNDIVRDEDKTSLIDYRLLLIPENTASENDNYKQSSNANRLWKNKK